jgi:hypothetical protein
MGSPKFMSELSGSQLGSISWFISFGDLLTLLVCFFLLLTPRLGAQHEQIQSEQGFGKARQPVQTSGTTLASSVSDVKGASSDFVPVWRNDIRSGVSNGSSSDAQEGWVSALVDKTHQGAIATVQVCESESEVEVMSQAMEQLRVVDESASRVTFQLGAECELWKRRFASPQQLVAVVYFS